MISIHQLVKKYGSNTILNNITLQLNKGGVYGVMGENRAGKSTLFRCVSGLERYEGSIVFEKELRIGYLPDIPYFYPMVTGREFIEFCLSASKVKYFPEKIDVLNKQFKLPLDKFPSKYSLGMRKRLMLLVLMLQDCDFYVMDEPFNGLDLVGTLILKKWIEEEKRKERVILLSSHIISSLTDICDELVYIHAGEVVKTFYQGRTSLGEIEKYLKEQIALS